MATLTLPNEHFYEQLPAVTDFSALADSSCYQEIPGDWAVVVADVKGSGAAIREGKYKEVNALGVCVLAAVVNAAKPLHIPYVFGGDGASLCIPPGLIAKTREVLKLTQKLARESYGLELRTGVMPVAGILQAGYRVLVARFQTSGYCTQAAFSGGGVAYAEDCLKKGALAEDEPGNAAKVEADYSGLECRWKNIPSPRGETVSLLVRPHPETAPESAAEIYREVIAQIEWVYDGWPECHPLAPQGLHLAFNIKKLLVEFKSRTFGKSAGERLGYGFKMLISSLFGLIVMKFKVSLGNVRWGDYKQQIVENADVRKFDDMLKVVISGTSTQRKKLFSYLDTGYRVKRLVYGAHISKSALMTCLIHNYAGEHYHFIDGADGGYAAAALEMKKRLESRNFTAG